MKRLLTLAAVLALFAGEARALQPILTVSTLGTTVQQYSQVGSNSAVVTTVDDASWSRAGAAGTLSKLQVYMSAAPAVGASRTVTLKVNGATTALACTVTDADWDCDEPSVSIAIAAGDILGLTYTLTGTPVSATAGVGMIFTPTTTDHQLFLTRATGVSGVAKSFMPFHQSSVIVFNTTEAGTQQLIGAAGTFSNMYVGASGSGAGTSGDAYTLKPSLAGVDTALGCQLLNTATTCNDTTNSFAVTQDQLMSIGSLPAVTPFNINIGVGMRFVPTTPGEFFFPVNAANNDSATGTQYLPIVGSRNNSSVESATITVWPAGGPFTLNRIRVQAVDPGGSASRTFTLRKGSGVTGVMANTALACTIPFGSTTCVMTGSVSFAQTDLASISNTPVGTAAVGMPKITLTGVIGGAPPPVASKRIMLLGVGR